MKQLQVNGYKIELCQVTNMWHVDLGDGHSCCFENLEDARKFCAER